MFFRRCKFHSRGITLSHRDSLLRKVQHPSQVMFAAVPLLFAVQQLSEGVLWPVLPKPGNEAMKSGLTYLYLFFAQAVWPIWIPLALLYVERERSRKNIQRVLAAIGAIVALYLYYCLVSYDVRAQIIGYHVYYEQHYPPIFKVAGEILYVIATILPPFFSHIKKMWLLGVTVLISYAVTTLFYDYYIVSVWCFFASVISLAVYFIMTEITTAHRLAGLVGRSKKLPGSSIASPGQKPLL